MAAAFGSGSSKSGGANLSGSLVVIVGVLADSIAGFGGSEPDVQPAMSIAMPTAAKSMHECLTGMSLSSAILHLKSGT